MPTAFRPPPSTTTAIRANATWHEAHAHLGRKGYRFATSWGRNASDGAGLWNRGVGRRVGQCLPARIRRLRRVAAGILHASVSVSRGAAAAGDTASTAAPARIATSAAHSERRRVAGAGRGTALLSSIGLSHAERDEIGAIAASSERQHHSDGHE